MTNIIEIDAEIKRLYKEIKRLKKIRKKLSTVKDNIYKLDPFNTNDKEYENISNLAKMINQLSKEDNQDKEINLIKDITLYFINSEDKPFSNEDAILCLNNVQKYLNHFKGITLDEIAKTKFMIYIYPIIEFFGVNAYKEYKYYKKPNMSTDTDEALSFLDSNGNLKSWQTF